MNNTPSRYQKLWDAIKEDASSAKPKGVAIAAHIDLHSRIIKAIKARKLKDTGYKFLCDMEDKGFCKLEFLIEGTKITFSLKFTTTAEDL